MGDDGVLDGQLVQAEALTEYDHLPPYWAGIGRSGPSRPAGSPTTSNRYSLAWSFASGVSDTCTLAATCQGAPATARPPGPQGPSSENGECRTGAVDRC